MRILIVTEKRSTASFRVRWGRFLPRFEQRGEAVEVAEVAGGSRRRIFSRAREFDLVVLQRRLFTALDFRRLRSRARRLVFDFDDALCFRPRPPHRSATRLRRFLRTVAGSDLVLAGNRYLASLARLRARAVIVIPSSIEPERYAVQVPKLSRPTAVWIGQKVTLPYLEPVREAVLMAGFTLHVIADAAPEGCTPVPWSLQSEPLRLAECHVGLMPLFADPYARGKCGYKLLQYYAAGLPAVASPVGPGRVLADGGALPASTPAEWEGALRRLREDADLRARLGARGRAYAAFRYSAEGVFERLVRVLASVSARPRAS